MTRVAMGGRHWHVWALAALMALAASRIVFTYQEFNVTMDEYGHIASSIEPYQRRSYTLDLEHPPLGRLAIGLLPYLSGARLTPGDKIYEVGFRLLEGPDYWKILRLARLGTLAFVPLLVFYVYRWSSLLYGRKAGLAAALLISFSPNILAHGSLATLDLPAAATTFVAAFYLWRWSEQPGLRRCVAAAAACGVAAATKFSAFVHLPLMFLGFFLLARVVRRRFPFRLHPKVLLTVLGRAAVFATLVCAVLGIAYLADTSPMTTAAERPHLIIDRWVAPGSPLHAALYGIAETSFFPPSPLWHGLETLRSHALRGHFGYLLGEIRTSGWWYYFPVVLAVKSTLPLLLLALLGGGVLLGSRGAESRRGAIYLLTGAAVVMGVAMTTSINIGVRHILAVYPFLAVLASASFSAGRAMRWFRVRTALATLLLVWHAADSLLAHPDYLAYFNPIARGREERFLADSNLDWGQDLARLSRYLQARGIEEVHLSYFGVTNPAGLGIRNARPFDPEDRPRGWIAISANHLLGIRIDGPPAGPGFRWLRAYQPHARIGKSIWLYHLP